MRKIFALGLVAAGMFMAGEASAQCPDLPPINTEFTCYFVNGSKVVVTPGGPVPTGSSGSATVYVVGYNFNPCEAILEPRKFGSTGQSSSLGSFNTNLAPNSPPSRLRGNNSTLFPASLELNLNITATASSLTGTFVSQGPLTLRATNIPRLPLSNISVKQDATQTLKLTNERNQSIGLQGVGVVLNGQ